MFNITGSYHLAEVETNIMVTLDTAALINDGKMEGDCSDIMVTDQTGAKIPHWVADHSCGTSNTYIWVKVPILKPSGNALSLYYGDANFNSAYSGTDVFASYFEDFEDVTLAELQTGATQSVPSSRFFDSLELDLDGSLLLKDENGDTSDPSLLCLTSANLAKTRRLRFTSTSNEHDPYLDGGKLKFNHGWNGYHFTETRMNFLAPINDNFSMVTAN